MSTWLVTLAALSACRPPDPGPQRAELSGRIALSWDADRRRGHLIVASYLPAELPLPAERHGIAMESCRRVVPRATIDGVLRPAEVSASCEGLELELEERLPGLYAHRFTEPLEAGTTCAVTLDGRSYTLPPLSPVPDLSLRGGRARWTPGDGDELRLTMPRSREESTVCRLSDDGRARVPRPGDLAFVSRHHYALPRAEDDSRIAITATAGRWWERGAGR